MRGSRGEIDDRRVQLAESQASIAQLVEQQTLNLLVLGSSPSVGTKSSTMPRTGRALGPFCIRAKVAELADALDLGSSGPKPFGIDSRLSHQTSRKSIRRSSAITSFV